MVGKKGGTPVHEVRGPMPVLWDSLEGYGTWGGRWEGVPDGGTCIPVADSCLRIAKKITILQNNYPPIKTNQLIKKKKKVATHLVSQHT